MSFLLAGNLTLAQPRQRTEASDSSLPPTSLFNLNVSLETSEGDSLKLADLHGRPLIIAMFYAQCTSVCPMLTSRLKALVDGLPAEEARRLRVLMVSFDSDRDSPQSLAEFKKEHGIEGPNWVLARTSKQNVRLLSAALGVRYRELPDHSFSHSAVITLADAEGVVCSRASEVLEQPEDLMRALHQQLHAAD